MKLASPDTSTSPAYNASGKRVALIVCQFNSLITEALAKAAIQTLTNAGIAPTDMTRFDAPGALEVPFIAAQLIEQNSYDAIIALGCVIKGDTYHFEIVCNESARGINELNLLGETPILNGIITAYTPEQAEARSGQNEHNKGHEAALAALQMMAVCAQIHGQIASNG